jgi:hypothetical protein
MNWFLGRFIAHFEDCPWFPVKRDRIAKAEARVKAMGTGRCCPGPWLSAPTDYGRGRATRVVASILGSGNDSRSGTLLGRGRTDQELDLRRSRECLDRAPPPARASSTPLYDYCVAFAPAACHAPSWA